MFLFSVADPFEAPPTMRISNIVRTVASISLIMRRSRQVNIDRELTTRDLHREKCYSSR